MSHTSHDHTESVTLTSLDYRNCDLYDTRPY